MNPLKLDPTRTTTLRRALLAELRRRVARLKGRVCKQLELTVNEQSRDERGRFAKIAGAAKAAGKALYDRLPGPVQKVVDFAHHIEHKLEGMHAAGRELALAVAQERGLPNTHVDRVGRVLGVADGIARWTTNIPATHAGLELGVHALAEAAGHAAVHALEAVGGPVGWALFGAAKIGYYVPVASLAYVAYSLTRGVAEGHNPLTLIRDARDRVRRERDPATHNVWIGSFTAQLLRRFDEVDPDEYEALLMAALDETRGDLEEAVLRADECGFMQRKSYDCGVAALATVLGEWPADLEGRLRASPLTGVERRDIARVARGLGHSTRELQGLAELRTAGAPVIALVQSDGSQARRDAEREGHYVVVLGVDDDSVLVHDPARGERRVDLRHWMRDWHGDTQRQWGLVVNDALADFKSWLRSQLGPLSDRQLWRKYVEAGYRKGVQRMYSGQTGKPPDYVAGGKDEFVRGTLSSPVGVERVQRLAERTFSEMENVTEDAATRMVRSLADGLVRGQSPREIAGEMADSLDLGLARAATVARTEIVRAHAEGQLDALDRMGVRAVGVEVEWTVAAGACEECSALAGAVFDIDEARGMLPQHPNCRCCWVPAITGNSEQPRDDRGRWAAAVHAHLAANPVVHRTGGIVRATGLKKSQVESALRDLNASGAIWSGAKGHKIAPAAAPAAAAPDLSAEIRRHVAEQHSADRHLPLSIKDLHGKLSGVTPEQLNDHLRQMHAAGEIGLEPVTRSNVRQAMGPHIILMDQARDVVAPGQEVYGYVTPPRVRNAFCPTGPGGGVDPSCGRHTRVGKAEHVRAAQVEREVAAAISGVWEEDNAFYDVKTKDEKHFVEVKSLLKGDKQTLSVHDDSMMRKIVGTADAGGTFHTVAVDEREGLDSYTGHRMYYKRGAGRYTVGLMHPVKSAAELKRLIRMKDEDLPEAARGKLPQDSPELRAKAEREHQRKLEKDRRRRRGTRDSDG